MLLGYEVGDDGMGSRTTFIANDQEVVDKPAKATSLGTYI